MSQKARQNKIAQKEAQIRRKKLMKKLLPIVSALAVVLLVVSITLGCASNKEIPEDKYPVATIVFADYGEVEITLYPNQAPNTVKNFISLANAEFYDGMKIARISTNFVIQMGSPDGSLQGDPGYSIAGEFIANGFQKNNIAHQKGVISMARGGNSYDSAGCQFFICTDTNYSVSNLDYYYAAFGKVTKGIEIIDQINALPHDNSISAGGGVPLDDIIVTSIRVDTKGIRYGQPAKIK